MVPIRVEEGPHGDLGGIPREGEHGNVGGGDGVEAFADGGQVSGPRLSGAGTGSPPEPVPVGRKAGKCRFLQELRVRFGTQLLMFFNIDVHSHHAHDFCDDEREGAEIEGPAIGVTLLRVTLPWVSSIG